MEENNPSAVSVKPGLTLYTKSVDLYAGALADFVENDLGIGANTITAAVEGECLLWGPAMGDAPLGSRVARYYQPKGANHTYRVCDRPTRKTRTYTVIVGEDRKRDGLAIVCGYFGPPVPRFPGCPAIWGDPEELVHSARFWSDHALSLRGPRFQVGFNSLPQ